MALTDEQRLAVFRRLDYPATTESVSARTASRMYDLDRALSALPSTAEPEVIACLERFEALDDALDEVPGRLAAIRVEDIYLRDDEGGALAQEYRRWQLRLASLVGVDPNRATTPGAIRTYPG